MWGGPHFFGLILLKITFIESLHTLMYEKQKKMGFAKLDPWIVHPKREKHLRKQLKPHNYTGQSGHIWG